jgi:hypothetical protein
MLKWRHVQEQAEKEHERELQAIANADELHRRQEIKDWLVETWTNAEREIAKNPPVDASVEDGEKRARPGRKSKDELYRDMLREIRTQTPESDGEIEFRARLTKGSGGKPGLSKGHSRRCYVQADAELAQEKRDRA